MFENPPFRNGRNFLVILTEAFGEVWAEDLTKRLAEILEICISSGLSMASGETHGQNLIRRTKNDTKFKLP